MTRKKQGFLLFIFSLLPGAGEMYMGFFKQGISIMSTFFAMIAVASFLEVGPILFLLPVLWCYSFFRVHNLGSLSDEEFYTIEDNFWFNVNQEEYNKIFSGNNGRKILAAILLIIGTCSIWSVVSRWCYEILHYFKISADIFYSTISRVPQIAIAILCIVLGIRLVRGKKKELDLLEDSVGMEEKSEEKSL